MIFSPNTTSNTNLWARTGQLGQEENWREGNGDGLDTTLQERGWLEIHRVEEWEEDPGIMEKGAGDGDEGSKKDFKLVGKDGLR